MFMYGGVTVIVSREILTNNLCKQLLYISILMQAVAAPGGGGQGGANAPPKLFSAPHFAPPQFLIISVETISR